MIILIMVIILLLIEKKTHNDNNKNKNKNQHKHNTTHARIHPKPNTCVHAQPHRAPTEQQQSKENPHTITHTVS